MGIGPVRLSQLAITLVYDAAWSSAVCSEYRLHTPPNAPMDWVTGAALRITVPPTLHPTSVLPADVT